MVSMYYWLPWLHSFPKSPTAALVLVLRVCVSTLFALLLTVTLFNLSHFSHLHHFIYLQETHPHTHCDTCYNIPHHLHIHTHNAAHHTNSRDTMKSPHLNQRTNSESPSIDRLSLPEMHEVEGSVHEMKGKNFNYWLTKDGDFDSEDAHIRIKPEALDTLCQMTKFTRKELQYMYRGFKQECPSGLVKEETFKMIYAQFFPRSDSHLYAHYVFNTFDPNHTGVITFTDFVVGLSALARGTAQDKLRWAFSLYDLDGDGVLSKDELYRIIWSIYDLLGRSDPYVDESSARVQAETVFKRLDINKDGVITIEEFLDSCLRDENITQSLAVFNTIL